jgi:hypothetical protein
MNTLKTPTFYRQRFLLLLFKMAGNRLSKIDFQKLLFLSQQEAEFSYYDFVPYYYGCYSFQAKSDIDSLIASGWLAYADDVITLLNEPDNYLKERELNTLYQFSEKFSHFRGEKLVNYVYENYPYYAIKSVIASDILTSSSYTKVRNIIKRLNKNDTLMYTIGYEGISLETYINRLIKNDIRLLCDVRRNPLSRKFGFSKKTLEYILPKLGIEYLHIPDLGIASKNRKTLNSTTDYENLFAIYQQNLPEKTESLALLERLLHQYKRIALTCFEKHHQSCHRHCVSDFLAKNNHINVCHL